MPQARRYVTQPRYSVVTHFEFRSRHDPVFGCGLIRNEGYQAKVIPPGMAASLSSVPLSRDGRLGAESLFRFVVAAISARTDLEKLNSPRMLLQSSSR
jgi:hypothetical protein